MGNPTGGGLHLVTDFEHDNLGRTTQELGPAHTVDLEGTATSVRRASWNIYKDASDEVRSAQGYATGENWDTFTLINPVSITLSDKAGNVLEEIQAVRASTSGKLSASDSFPQSSYVRFWVSELTPVPFLFRPLSLSGKIASIFRRLALTILQQDTTIKSSIRGKRLQAGWNTDVLDAIVTSIGPN